MYLNTDGTIFSLLSIEVVLYVGLNKGYILACSIIYFHCYNYFIDKCEHNIIIFRFVKKIIVTRKVMYGWSQPG